MDDRLQFSEYFGFFVCIYFEFVGLIYENELLMCKLFVIKLKI